MATQAELQALSHKVSVLGFPNLFNEAEAARDNESEKIRNIEISQDELRFLLYNLLLLEENFGELPAERVEEIEKGMSLEEKKDLLAFEMRDKMAIPLAKFGINLLVEMPDQKIANKGALKLVVEAFVHEARYYDKKLDTYLRHGLTEEEFLGCCRNCGLTPAQIKLFNTCGAPTIARGCNTVVQQRQALEEDQAPANAIPDDPDKQRLVRNIKGTHAP